MMFCTLIVAVDEKGGIGMDNDLMWHLPTDMKFFKETTNGQVVILGRKNYESIPERFRPLPNRLNIVISRNDTYDTKGAVLVNSLPKAIESAYKLQPDKKVFIIGGGEIYRWALEENYINEMIITHVHHQFDADTFFPLESTKGWKEEVISDHPEDENNCYSFTIKRYWK